ncbi:hypothetical protein KKB11_01425 [Candidatus Micrarchaeota archaeon]|nr:hypothetical protein [Candidatus Micrarchaeota archaeon]
MEGITGKKQKDFNKTLKIKNENSETVAEELFEQMKSREESRKRKEKAKTRTAEKGKGKEENISWKERREQRLKGTEKKEKKKGESSKTKKNKEEIPAWKKRQMEREKGQGKESVEKKQVKTEEKEKKGRRRERKKEEEEVLEENETELKGTQIKGLFGEETTSAKEKMDEELKLDLNLDGEISENEGFEAEEKKGKCPNCKKEFNELIFCSKCGNAFCDKCAKTKQKTDKGTKYVCPSCGHPTKK